MVELYVTVFGYLVVVLPFLVASHKVTDLYLYRVLKVGFWYVKTEVILIYNLIQISIVKFLLKMS